MQSAAHSFCCLSTLLYLFAEAAIQKWQVTHTQKNRKRGITKQYQIQADQKKWKKQANTNIANQHCLLFIGYRVHSRMRYRFLFASISGWLSLLLFSPLPPFLCFISAGCRCCQPIALETKHTHTPTQALPIGNILFATDATACSKQTERETHKLVSLLQHKATKHTHTVTQTNLLALSMIFLWCG